jgi:hypothetical protein
VRDNGQTKVTGKCDGKKVSWMKDE